MGSERAVMLWSTLWSSASYTFCFVCGRWATNRIAEGWRTLDDAFALVPKETSGENCILSFPGHRLKRAVSLAYLLQPLSATP
jgi:hypothetical protein